MTPLDLLREVVRFGAMLDNRDGVLSVSPPGRLPPDLRGRVVEARVSLLEVLADPRKAAYRAWEATLGEISGAWEHYAAGARQRGEAPRWLDDEPLMGSVRQAIVLTLDAAGLAEAIAAMEVWRQKWFELILPSARPAGRSSGEELPARQPGEDDPSGEASS